MLRFSARAMGDLLAAGDTGRDNLHVDNRGLKLMPDELFAQQGHHFAPVVGKNFPHALGELVG